METLNNTIETPRSDAAVPSLVQPLHVVLVARNAAKGIESYLRSVSAYCQTLAPSAHRITVIDCDSTDRTLALAEMVARDIPEVAVKYSCSENLCATLASLDIEDDSIMIYADIARRPNPVMMQDGAYAVSELDWDIVATLENSDPEQKNWRVAAHRVKNSLRPAQRDDISFLTLRGSVFRSALQSLKGAVSENLTRTTARIFVAAQNAEYGASKPRYLVRQVAATTKENPLASLNAALTVSVSAGLLALTVFTQVYTSV